MTKQEVLKCCIVEGNVIKLPDVKLDRNIYLEVAKALELIGGKWKGGKISGFVFNHDPTELLYHLCNDQTDNHKKDFQFFETPSDLADELVQLSNIGINNTVLEPSAGQGSIVNAINRVYPDMVVDCYELMDINRLILVKNKNVNLTGYDFLKADGQYDTIIANPPFSKNQDIDHILKMYSLLKVNGRLVSVASKHWMLSKNKKEVEFSNWLNSVNAEVIEIEEGRFKSSGTMIGGVIIIINK